jgi:ATP-dependent DNA helicase PIF1
MCLDFRDIGKIANQKSKVSQKISIDASKSEGDAFLPDVVYERSPGIGETLSAIRSGAPVVFISGRAGSGKSKLINYLRKMPSGKSQVVVAPTGIAAQSLSAMTIHSAFRLPLGVINGEELSQEDNISHVFQGMKRLIIDEISMVRADILDGIDKRLQAVRGDSRPFGGVQVVMVGDFLQLPPVVSEEDRDKLINMGYETPFAFSAKVLEGARLRVAALTKVWRQTNPEMIQALGEIREGRNSEHAVKWLNDACARDHRPGVVPLLLTATRTSADEYNKRGIKALVDDADGPVRSAKYAAIRHGIFEKDSKVLPAPEVLNVVPGLRVMSVKNDPSGNFVNGSLGTVLSFVEGEEGLKGSSVRVLFDESEDPVIVEPSCWKKKRQVWSRSEGAPVEEVIGSFKQIPLVHGYAITIHKSQGLSLDDVRVDLGRGAFAPGQLYVALSRARSPEGLSLARPISVEDVRVDELLVAFLRWAREVPNLEFEPNIT